MLLEPVTMRPSAGRFSPGRTRTIWPGPSRESSTSCSSPSSSRRAMSGVRSMRSRIARWAPHAVRLRIRLAVHRKNARKPAARKLPVATAAATARHARESLEAWPREISRHAPSEEGYGQDDRANRGRNLSDLLVPSEKGDEPGHGEQHAADQGNEETLRSRRSAPPCGLEKLPILIGCAPATVSSDMDDSLGFWIRWWIRCGPDG